jgi:streptomycin 3"-adenylyltransferase
VLSKKEGGEWGLENLPAEFHPLLDDALKDYEGSKNAPYNMDCAKKYAEYMLSRII